jgi:hypothetical protein
MSRVLPDTYKEETYCYERRNLNWSDYYLVPDLPRVHAPIDHRPVWKGVGKTPNQAHSTLIEVQPRDRKTFGSNGFLPHASEFTHYTQAINQESSLRNLDTRLTNRAFGRRVIQELSHPSHDTYAILPDYRAKSLTQFTEPQTIQPDCTLERKYDHDLGMNGARFNNSTRASTRNLRVPYVKQSKRAPIPEGRPGYGGTRTLRKDNV